VIAIAVLASWPCKGGPPFGRRPTPCLTDRFRLMRSILCFSLLLMMSIAASAQTACPQGVPPGDPRCGPSSNWHQGQVAQEPEAAPRLIVRDRYQVLEDRWGAVSRDPQGPLGVAEAQASRDEAMRVAVSDCVRRGGDLDRCRNNLTPYRNSCAVYAWGNGFGQLVVKPEARDAHRVALELCMTSAEAVCDIVYSGCSHPKESWTYERPANWKPAR